MAKYAAGHFRKFRGLNETKIFAENIFKTSNLEDIGISSPAVLFETNLKLHNIYITPKLVEQVITNLSLSKMPGHDCIPVVVLKDRGLVLS